MMEKSALPPSITTLDCYLLIPFLPLLFSARVFLFNLTSVLILPKTARGQSRARQRGVMLGIGEIGIETGSEVKLERKW